MIQIIRIGGKQFMKARALGLPVIVVNARTFRMPSSRAGKPDHTVELDSSESPTACSCTCEAGEHDAPCWAMARALDVLTALGVHNIYVGRASPGRTTSLPASDAIRPALRASIDEAGDMFLMTVPETEMLYVGP